MTFFFGHLALQYSPGSRRKKDKLDNIFFSYCHNQAMAKKIVTAFVYYIIVVVVADLVGVLAVTIFDIFIGRFGALYYTIWLVIGVFGGIFYMGACQKGSPGQYSPADGILATLVSLVLSTVLIFVFYQLGEMPTNVGDHDYYVPGHKYVTYTFFITFVVTAFLGRNFSG
jgi:hypothetical protein